MAGCINRATLLGHLGKDPEIRSMGSGDRVANLSIATSESWTDKQTGEKKERTQWHNVVAWGPVVDVIDKYVRKGSKVLVEGSIETRKWQDKDGNDRWSTEIVMRGFGSQLVLLGDPKGSGGDRGRDDDSAYSGQNGGSGGGGYGGGYGGASGGGVRGDGYAGGNASGVGFGSGGVFGGSGPKESFPADLDDEIPF